MAMSLSTATEHAKGMLESGEVKDAGEANVAIVRMMGVRIIDSPIPREIRKALMAAVKDGKLGWLPRKAMVPEAFFHPNARAHAMDVRERVTYEKIEAQAKALMATMVHHSDIPSDPQ